MALSSFVYITGGRRSFLGCIGLRGNGDEDWCCESEWALLQLLITHGGVHGDNGGDGDADGNEDASDDGERAVDGGFGEETGERKEGAAGDDGNAIIAINGDVDVVVIVVVVVVVVAGANKGFGDRSLDGLRDKEEEEEDNGDDDDNDNDDGGGWMNIAFGIAFSFAQVAAEGFGNKFSLLRPLFAAVAGVVVKPCVMGIGE
eukprot:jgi/Bigna1/133354/aug1.21_g8062